MDTKERAIGEAEAWEKAHELLFIQEPTVGTETQNGISQGQSQVEGIACFTDGSWKDGEATSGWVGFYRTTKKLQS
ncbi:unnamed protein product [Cochlearia groenlandica]